MTIIPSCDEAGPFTARLQTTEDATAALRKLAGGRSYGSLVRDFPHVSRSMAAWYGWLTGKRQPGVRNLLSVVEALGGEVVIRRRRGLKSRPGCQG